jgi:hypothetical protein
MELPMASSNSSPGGQFIRSRNRLDQQIAAEKKYAPGRYRGAAYNAKVRGDLPKRSFRGSPTVNAARRGS